MNHLTSVEIYIWNYLEENKAKIIQMTVAQIAESAHVSPSSIIRTLKKKNFSSFSEYKNMEKQKLNRHDWIYGLTKDANQVVSENIEELLMSRYVSAKQRKSGRRTRGPAKRTDEVRNQFLKQLDKILIQA